MVMQKTIWGGALVLGILLAGFIFIAGCDGVCENGKCGTWFSYSGSPTNGQVVQQRTLVLNQDMSYTLVSKTTVPSTTFGQSIPGNDQVVTGTWEQLAGNMIKLDLPAYGGQSMGGSFNQFIILQYDPGVPRLVVYGTDGTATYDPLCFYRNANDWGQHTQPSGYPYPLPA
jgi:hypothetical protein